ncbi:MAG: molybdenum cofactor guanylyltransferase [Lachnospiraceae bacterium]|nr:molybdenum cofactor guanylyltransferase [Lachnospiraceae bacterium]
MKVAQLLLMGGKNSRMGRPKALLTWRGKTFFERITEEMRICGPVYISVDKKEHVPACSFPVIEDRYEAIGPMGGLASALEVISEDALFVCACDMPKVTAELIRKLTVYLDEDTDAVIVRKENGRLYMTGAVYSKKLLPGLKEQIRKKNYRMRSVLERARVKFLDFEELGLRPDSLDNINTPEDYENLIRDEII